MSETRIYEFSPAIRCWVKHLVEGRYNAKDKSLFTIFGALKRVRLVATITNKEEFVSKRPNDINSTTEEIDTNLRFEFEDGTGIISAVNLFLPCLKLPNLIALIPGTFSPNTILPNSMGALL